MKLYIKQCMSCSNRIDLSIDVKSRQTLRYMYGETITIKCPTCGHIHNYYPHQVIAESTAKSVLGGGLTGGLVGLLGGPIGFLIGVGIGGAIGNENDKIDREKVEKFNSSW